MDMRGSNRRSARAAREAQVRSRPLGLLLTCWMCAAAPLIATRAAVAEDGYRLWMRYDPVESADRRAEYARAAGQAVVQEASETGRVIRSELAAGLSGLTGTAVPVAGELAAGPPGGVVVVGTPAGSPLVRSLNWDADLAAVGDEGFVIRSVTLAGRPATVVASVGRMGLLYGTFDLLRRLQTEQSIADLHVSDAPKLRLRLLDHWDNPDRSVERGYAGKSIWNWPELPSKVDPRYADYARADASLGINGAVLNNVAAKPQQLDADHLRKAAAVADVLRPYGVRVFLSVNVATPQLLGGLPTADPLDPAVAVWWRAKADEVYGLIPDFGGFLVKANAEGQPGPRDYHRTPADGANCLADALAPHGGVVMWRCFTYDESFDRDRAKRSFKEFAPLDGTFRPNVFLQVKNGPIDFQPREPFHPLFGGMPRTPLMAELQVTQEYTGHSTSLCYLGSMWAEFLNADTRRAGPGTTVASVLEHQRLTGIAGAANTGSDRNWCGSDFAQANWYAFGRLAWDPGRSADAVADEWVRMTWGNDPRVVSTVGQMMRGSREAVVSYEMPIGLVHLMEGGNHYAAAPDRQPAYHNAGRDGIGYDRTAAGSDALVEYAPDVARAYGNLATCPDDLLLWFHHVPWDYRMRSGRTVWDELQFRYTSGVDYVKGMQAAWDTLRGRVDDQRFDAVRAKLAKQANDAAAWRDVCLEYFGSKRDGR